jgi:hypothetical protein
MRKSTIVLLALIAICVSAAGCRKKSDTELKPSKLMGKLNSGDSLKSVQRELDIKPTDWETLEDRSSLIGSQPQWRSLVLQKKNHEAYGQFGDLVVTFFNDQLISVQFYPIDVPTARDAIAAADRVNFSPAGDAKISVSTRIWIGKDSQGRGYIGWIDKTRQELRDRAVQ